MLKLKSCASHKVPFVNITSPSLLIIHKQIEKYLAGFAPKRVFSFHSQQRTKVDCLNVKKGVSNSNFNFRFPRKKKNLLQRDLIP